MGSPRLAEAPDEHVVARLEVEHLERNLLRPELVEHSRELGEEVPRADVDPERHAPDLVPGRLPELDETRDERDREIVDAVEAEVLEHMDGGRLAGTREPGDDDEPEALRHERGSRARFSRRSASS